MAKEIGADQLGKFYTEGKAPRCCSAAHTRLACVILRRGTPMIKRKKHRR